MAILCALGASAARPKVAIVLGADADEPRLELETRLRAELAIAAFDTVVVEGSPETDPESLERAARATGSFAAIAVLRERAPGAEVWVADRITGKTVRRRVNFDARSPDAAAIFAIRAVELLHASLLELSEAHPARGEVAAAPGVKEWVIPKPTPAAEPAREARVGAAVIDGPGGIPATVVPSIGFGWVAVPGWVGSIEVWGPGFAHATQPEGDVRLDEEAAIVSVRAELTRAGPLTPFGKVGLGGYHLGARGTASPPYAAHSADIWSAAGTLGIGLSVRGMGPLRLLAGLDALLLTPKPGVVVSGRTIASGGRPLLVGQAGLGIEW